MIRLSHLDGEPFILNAEWIQYVEARPDTFITLTSGERLVVRETMDQVLERTLAYQQSKYLVPPRGGDRAQSDALRREARPEA